MYLFVVVHRLCFCSYFFDIICYSFNCIHDCILCILIRFASHLLTFLCLLFHCLLFTNCHCFCFCSLYHFLYIMFFLFLFFKMNFLLIFWQACIQLIFNMILQYFDPFIFLLYLCLQLFNYFLKLTHCKFSVYFWFILYFLSILTKS